MSSVNNLEDALVEELKDLYSAESQLTKALPKMAKAASSDSLREAFEAHLEETHEHIARLEQVGEVLGRKLNGKTCVAMKGLIEEGSELMKEGPEDETLMDALLIGAAQRVEHYEISAYGTARAFAQTLGRDDIVDLLSQTLEEESAADEKLTAISEDEILPASQRSDAEAEVGEEEEDMKSTRHRSGKESNGSNRKKAGGNGRSAKRVMAVLALGGILLGTAPDSFADDSRKHQAARHEADNTGRNARDAEGSRATASDQMLDEGGRETLAAVRREIVAREDLSTSAHNVKLVFENSALVLRGPVSSEAEKRTVAELARKAAPGTNVRNELEVTVR